MSTINLTPSASNTEVWLKIGHRDVEVIVVGCDSRILASVDAYLKNAAAGASTRVYDENPADVKGLPYDWSYTGFSVEDGAEPSVLAAVTGAAGQLPWVSAIRLGGEWPAETADPSERVAVKAPGASGAGTVPDGLEREHLELQKFAAAVEVREDWHEPDEQGVSASVVGTRLDNAFGSAIRETAIQNGYQETVVVLHVAGWLGDPVCFNLASLLALASR